MYKLHSLQHPDWHRTGTSYCYCYIFEIIHHDIVFLYFLVLKIQEEFSKIIPSFFTIKEGSTFLTPTLFNGLYTPFGSPLAGDRNLRDERM